MADNINSNTVKASFVINPNGSKINNSTYLGSSFVITNNSTNGEKIFYDAPKGALTSAIRQ